MLRQARAEELDKIMEFYGEVIDAQEGAGFELYWKKDGYPSRKMIETSIQRGEFYVEMEEKDITCLLYTSKRCCRSVKRPIFIQPLKPAVMESGKR